MTAPLNAANIVSTDWQPRLASLGEIVEGVEDVAQCIRAILLTPKGSVPHAPDFGSNVHLYVDWPLQAGRPQIIRETIDAITLNESRVRLVRVSVEQASPSDPDFVASIVIEIEWTTLGTSAAHSTSVVIGRAT